MKHLLWMALLLCGESVNAQSGTCDRTWLNAQKLSGMAQPPWEEYVGPRVRRLYRTAYFNMSSNNSHDMRIAFQAGKRYTILYFTGAEALASGLELRDATGLRVEFEKVYGKSLNNWLELTFDSNRGGVYTASVLSIFPNDGSSCAALLVREYDDEDWKERQRDRAGD